MRRTAAALDLSQPRQLPQRAAQEGLHSHTGWQSQPQLQAPVLLVSRMDIGVSLSGWFTAWPACPTLTPSLTDEGAESYSSTGRGEPPRPWCPKSAQVGQAKTAIARLATAADCR